MLSANFFSLVSKCLETHLTCDDDVTNSKLHNILPVKDLTGSISRD